MTCLPEADHYMQNSSTPIIDDCVEEICDALDNDCDGHIDEISCTCMMNDTSCYGGPPSTRNTGVCQDGNRVCDDRGETWLSCEDWQGPKEEVCDDIDNDCDSKTDEGVTNACGMCGDV